MLKSQETSQILLKTKKNGDIQKIKTNQNQPQERTNRFREQTHQIFLDPFPPVLSFHKLINSSGMSTLYIVLFLATSYNNGAIYLINTISGKDIASIQKIH
jgi:hypothetical protein